MCVECVCVSLEFEGAFTHVHTHVDGGQSRILGIFPCHPPLYCPESLTDLEVQGFSEAQRPENSRYQHVSTPSECWVCRCTAMPGCLSRCCGFKFTFSSLHSKHYSTLSISPDLQLLLYSCSLGILENKLSFGLVFFPGTGGDHSSFHYGVSVFRQRGRPLCLP